MEKSLKILILEDDPFDVELMTKILRSAGMVFTTAIVSEKAEFEAALNNHTFDIILADNSLPQFNAVSALRTVQQKHVDKPFILVTGTVSEEFAVDVIHQGADDYILKSNLKKLPSAIENAIVKWNTNKEKILAEQALRESEKRFRILFEQASDGIIICDDSGVITDANSSASAITGYSLKELKSLDIQRFFFDGDLQIQPIHFEALFSDKTTISEQKVKCKDAKLIYVELSAKMLPDGRIQIFIRDITYRKQLEARLLNEKIKHQKKIAQATLDGQEKERAEIGRELHDNINQILTASMLQLSAAEQDDTIKDQMIAKSIRNITNAINEIRKISKSLVAPTADDLSIIESIQDLIDTVKLTTPISIDMEVLNSFNLKINSRQRIALYRIVQEQINNIIKHAEAQHISMVLEGKENHVHMEIIDDGKGFDTKAKRSGIGLSNMQTRAELLNGKLDIESVKGKGCKLKLDLPLETEIDAPESSFSNA